MGWYTSLSVRLWGRDRLNLTEVIVIFCQMDKLKLDVPYNALSISLWECLSLIFMEVLKYIIYNQTYKL
jgi:hypothetical protein